MVEAEFWRLFATISATMIGLVFLGTFYYLESGWRTFEYFQTQMEALTVNYAKIIIAYFSTSLILSFVQEPFFPTELSTAGLVIVGVGVVMTTYSLNKELEEFQLLTKNRLYLWNKRFNWIWFIVVFALPLMYLQWELAVPTIDDFIIEEATIAWIVFLSLLFGYWNLILFLLTPFQMHKIERDKTAQQNKRKERQNDSPSEETWSDDRVQIAEERIADQLRENDLKRRPGFDIIESYKTNVELSADIHEPIIRYPPSVDKHGEASIHVLLSDQWFTDMDLLDQTALLAYHVGSFVRLAYRDLTGVVVRIHRRFLNPWDNSESEVMLLKARWTGIDLENLATGTMDTDEILESASYTILHPTLYPLGLREHNFVPDEREPDEDEDYSYYEIEDQSHGTAKRYTAKIIFNENLSKKSIRNLIPEIIGEIRGMEIHRNEQAKERWEGTDADVVWLSMFNESRKPPEMIENETMNHFIGKAEWFDSDLDPDYTPLKMQDVDESIDGIRVQWSDAI